MGYFSNAFASAFRNRQQPQQPTSGGVGNMARAIDTASQQPQQNYGNAFTGAYGGMAGRQPSSPAPALQQYQDQMVSQQRLQEPPVGAIGGVFRQGQRQAQVQAQQAMEAQKQAQIGNPGSMFGQQPQIAAEAQRQAQQQQEQALPFIGMKNPAPSGFGGIAQQGMAAAQTQQTQRQMALEAQEQAQNRTVDNPMRFINPPQMQVGTGVQNIPEVGRGFAGIPQGQPVLGARPQAPQGLLGAATNQLSKKERRKSKKNRRKQTRKAMAGMAYAGRRKDDR